MKRWQQNSRCLNQWNMLYTFVSWLQNFSGRPYPFDIVMCLVSAVPLTQEATKFSVPELQSKQKCKDFQVRTNVPLVCVILYCSNCFMLSSLSLIPNACATGMQGTVFPLCRRTASRLNLEASMNSLHSSEQWLMLNAVNKPSTTLHATRVSFMVKDFSKFFWR